LCHFTRINIHFDLDSLLREISDTDMSLADGFIVLPVCMANSNIAALFLASSAFIASDVSCAAGPIEVTFVWKGSLVALTTPFNAQNRIDYDALERLIDFHVDQGSDGLVVAGTTGESATLEKSEHIELVGRAAEYANGRLVVIAGTGSNSTQQTIELSLAVRDSGIDGYLLVGPYYNKPVQEGIYRHFSAIADAVDKPIMLYNVPGRTVTDILPETLARLAEHPNIVALKDATGDLQRLQDQQVLTRDDFLYFSGDDFTTLEFIERGGHGVVTVSGNVVPHAVAELCREASAGNETRARELDERLQPLNSALFLESNPIPVKWVLRQMGLVAEGIRLPLTPFAKEYHAQMLNALKIAGVSLEGSV
jgi:4-hydroxy-tetrahydrodipicolinate synthase